MTERAIVYVDKETHERLRAAAFETRISAGKIVASLVKQYLPKSGAKRRKEKP